MEKRSTAKITNKKHYATMMAAASSAIPSADSRCMARVQSALADMMSTTVGTKDGNRRHTSVPPSSSSSSSAAAAAAFMDLSGYALHQRLRTAPGTEMYVTGMRAKVMSPRDTAAAEPGGDTGTGDRLWARVDGCQYDPVGNTLEARMRFGRALMVSGSVRLLHGGGGYRVGGGGGGGSAHAETGCDMTLRLRPRAGLGFTAVPLTMPEKSPLNRLTATPTMTIRTTATFIDPEPAVDDPAATYVSVHSYNCVGGATGYPGNREHPAASSDRYEQILSAENGDSGGSSDELLTGGEDVDVDIDMNDDGDRADSFEFNDKRTAAGRRPILSSSSRSPSSSSTPATASAAKHHFTPAGFVSPPPLSPEPRLRKIQYGIKPLQHPVLSAAAPDNRHQLAQEQLLMEMEDVFVRGVRSLLAKHMERTLQPVLKDSLMANMGYTVSYG